MKMMSDGYLIGDGTWELTIYVTDLKVNRNLRVKGDLHVGGVMLKLVEDLDVSIDWSDHALWWPEKNQWLSRTRSTLDQYGVQADAILHFTPMHKTLRLQMPDLRYLDARVDFSVKTFTSVVNLCKDLGIRHPEEISFCRPLSPEHLKRNYKHIGISPRQRSTVGLNVTHTNGNLNNSHDSNDKSITPDGTMNHSNLSGPYSPSYRGYSPSATMNGSSPIPYGYMDGYIHSDSSLAHSPKAPSDEAKQNILRPKSLIERARLNAGWLDSSLSLMEQNVREYDTLLLRYKFYNFYDLNPKYDAVRINQVYEQAKWAILNEEIDCTEEEMMMFAALQVQINLQASQPQADNYENGEDDIDAALTDLQVTLEGSNISDSAADITHVPELGDYLRFMKPKRFTLKSFKRCYFTFRDTHLAAYKSKTETDTLFVINLKGCEVTPDVNLAQDKYQIVLEVPSHVGMTEYWLRCGSADQYARWMAAFRLAAKGKTMADSSYEAEVKSILDFLAMQRPAAAPALHPSQLGDLNPNDYVAPRFVKKLKGRQLQQRILEAHGNIKDLNLIDAKLNFIKAWQALPEFGITLFIVKFAGVKKEELLGIAFNRLMRMDLNQGDHIKTWRFNTMKAWNVNWEVKEMLVQFEEQNVAFSCSSADCKIVHEFIGGYIFLSMRSKDQNQTLNEELFHKLTGGWA